MFDTKLTAHLAELSKLEFTKDELEKITGEMDEIVALMDTVKDFESDEDFTGVDAAEYKNLRKDTPRLSMEREDVLKNAKDNADTYFKVPKVV